MQKPTIAVPAVSEEEAEQLRGLRGATRRVHKSVPAHSPVRKASADLSERLYRMYMRGVPLGSLASIVGLSHQAVRIRVRAAAEVLADTADASGMPAGVSSAPTLGHPADDVALVLDTGVHRRLHVYDPPESIGSGYLATVPALPLLKDRESLVEWLESSGPGLTGRPSVTATVLRTPPAVYAPREVVETVLVPLTADEEES